jgi:hypothetical protein
MNKKNTKIEETTFFTKQKNVPPIDSPIWDELGIKFKRSPAWDKIEAERKSGEKLIYEDDKWKIYIPKNPDHPFDQYSFSRSDKSIKHGDPNHIFNDPDDPILVIISKNEDTRYQFDYTAEDFTNKEDEDILYKYGSSPRDLDFRNFYEINDIIKTLSDKLPEVTINEAKKYERKSLPSGGTLYSNPKWAGYYNENNRLSRDDGPAFIYANGSEAWWKDGKMHRPGGLPAASYTKGDKQLMWLENGEFHNEKGPAIILRKTGEKKWFLRDKEYDTEYEWWLAVNQLRRDRSLREHFKRFI